MHSFDSVSVTPFGGRIVICRPPRLSTDIYGPEFTFLLSPSGQGRKSPKEDSRTLGLPYYRLKGLPSLSLLHLSNRGYKIEDKKSIRFIISNQDTVVEVTMILPERVPYLP